MLSSAYGLQHAFPHDYRSGPATLDWDPSKWIIAALHATGFASGLRRARDRDVDEAKTYMLDKLHNGENVELADAQCPLWTFGQVRDFVAANPGRCVLVISGHVVDATGYLGEHVSPMPTFV